MVKKRLWKHNTVLRRTRSRVALRRKRTGIRLIGDLTGRRFLNNQTSRRDTVDRNRKALDRRTGELTQPEMAVRLPRRQARDDTSFNASCPIQQIVENLRLRSHPPGSGPGLGRTGNLRHAPPGGIRHPGSEMLEATPVEFDLGRTQLTPHLLEYVVTRETDLARGHNTVRSHAGRPVDVPGDIQIRQTQLQGARRQALEIGKPRYRTPTARNQAAANASVPAVRCR